MEWKIHQKLEFLRQNLNYCLCNHPDFITSTITAANSDVDSRSLNVIYRDNETQKKLTVGNKRLLLEFEIKQQKSRSLGVFIHTHFGSSAGDFGVLMKLLYGISKRLTTVYKYLNVSVRGIQNFKLTQFPRRFSLRMKVKCGN